MPIPLDDLNRALIPRVLTPAITIAELLYLFAEQPEPQRCFAVVRVGRDGYDVLALDDLREALESLGESALALALSALRGLLRPAAPVHQDQIGLAAAKKLQHATPRRRLVVLDADGAVLGALVAIFMGTSKGLDDPLALIEPRRPAVLAGDEPAPPPAPAHLNTEFKGLGPNQPLQVGRQVSLLVWVGAPSATTLSRSTRPFAFDFAGAESPVAFNVYVEADPEAWEIIAVQPVMIVAPPGITERAAVFRVMARTPGSDKLRISVECADTGAAVQHVWLPVVAAGSEAPAALAPAATLRSEIALPLDSPHVARPNVEIAIQPGLESFRISVRADLPDVQIRETYAVPISSQAVQNAALRLRQELRTIVFHQEDSGPQAYFPFADEDTLMVDEVTARRVTVALADAGKQVWNMIFNPPRAPDGLKRLGDDLRRMPESSTFRVILESQDFIIPWALLYDKPGPVNVETLDWNGFWGYRYILDALPPGRYPAPTIKDAPLKLLLLFNDDERLKRFTDAQERFVREELGATQPSIAFGDAAIRQALMAPDDVALIYFYCHGDRKSGAETVEQPYREAARRARGDTSPFVAQLADESALCFSPKTLMRLADLRDLPIAALPHRPLIFLNACEGASQEAFYYDGFMPFFIEQQGARGFIGAEVKAPQLLGHDLALAFLRQFAQGRPVGEILWRLRRHYLDTHHTILVFNYSLYCLGEVCLARPLLAAE